MRNCEFYGLIAVHQLFLTKIPNDGIKKLAKEHGFSSQGAYNLFLMVTVTEVTVS
ncbi:MAG: hypothetical protein ACI83O_000887 [Patescibacteria group bacterium]|jgi:hypothetical protein